MACSKFEYVKTFENHDTLLKNTYIVIRIDGNGFTKFTDLHKFDKPNDIKALSLMNSSALHVMESYSDIFLAYGESDEYSFVIHKESNLFDRRKDKLVSNIVSIFTSYYVYNFEKIINKKLISLPNFDARAVCYPCIKNLIDYFSWRQADTHINNLYNTCFWNLVNSGISNQEAEKLLSKTLSKDKNELLFSKFGINYNEIHPMLRKGTVIYRSVKIDEIKLEKYNQLLKDFKEKKTNTKPNSPRKKSILEVKYIDIIQENFWKENLQFLYK